MSDYGLFYNVQPLVIDEELRAKRFAWMADLYQKSFEYYEKKQKEREERMATIMRNWHIPEQIVDDPASGLSFQFEKAPDGEMVLHVFGVSLPCGNRQFNFDKDGKLVGRGTSTVGPCKPTWPVNVEDMQNDNG